MEEHKFEYIGQKTKKSLEELGFYRLKQEEKFIVLTRTNYEPCNLAKTYANNEGVFRVILSKDKVYHLKVILESLPLYAVSKENVPTTWSCTQSASSLSLALYNENAYWDGQICDYDENAQPEDEKARLHQLKQIALTMHAVELFCYCCVAYPTAKRCLKFLITRAPMLLTMRATSIANRPPLELALLNVDVVACGLRDILICNKEKLTLTDTNRSQTLLAVYSTNGISPDHVKLTSDAMVRQYPRDSKIMHIKHETDEKGNNILLSLYELRFSKGISLDMKTLTYMTKRLVTAGVDATQENKDGHSALDILLDVFCAKAFLHGDKSRFTLSNYSQDVDENYKEAIYCIWIILCQLEAAKPSSESLSVYLITAFKVLVSRKIIKPESLYKVSSLLQPAVLNCRRPSSCQMCLPLQQVFYVAMCRGFNTHQSLPLLEHSQGTSTVEIIVKELLYAFKHVNMMPAHDQSMCPICASECCYFSLLELLVHCAGKDCERMILQSLANSPTSCMSPTQFASLVRMIWLYHPSPRDVIPDTVIQQHCQNATHIEKELQVMLQSVRPLKLACRLKILRSMQWRDTKELLLPRQLIQYVRFSDMLSSSLIDALIELDL